MKLQVAVVSMLFTSVAWAQPAVSTGGVLNAASYAAAALPNGGIAQGSLFVVFGRNLGPASLVQNAALPLQKALGNTSIKITVGSTAVDALMIYTSAGQVAGILPSTTPAGAGKLTVTYNNATSAAVDVQVVPASFGIFARNQAGSGPAIVQNYVSPGEQPVNAVNDVAHPGQVMILWGTGLGRISGDDAAAPPVGDLPTAVDVLVGSKHARVLYKGRAPGFPGVDQINFEIPQDVELGCYVPLAVRAGTVTSNFTSLAIATSGKTCSDVVSGFSSADLDLALAKGNLTTGNITLSRSRIKMGALPIPGAPTEMKTDTGAGSFVRYDMARLAAARISNATPYGACTVYNVNVKELSVQDPIAPEGLDAGSALNVTGPKGVKQLARTSKGYYSATIGGGGISFGGVSTGQPDYLEPGAYTVDNGAGGVDVGSFSARITIPAALNWTNADAITTVPRSQGLTLTWTAAGAAPDQYVLIFGASTISEDFGVAFICTERASRGTFTVDSAILSALPASQVDSSGIPNGFLALATASSGEGNKFQARGLDIGRVDYSDMTMKNVGYR